MEYGDLFHDGFNDGEVLADWDLGAGGFKDRHFAYDGGFKYRDFLHESCFDNGKIFYYDCLDNVDRFEIDLLDLDDVDLRNIGAQRFGRSEIIRLQVDNLLRKGALILSE